MTRPAYEYRHVVGFEETNLVGNVYFVNHVKWQGRCRELFLREHAPGLVRQLQEDLSLVTVSVSCDYLAEVQAFDEIAVRMRLHDAAQHRMTLDFEYVRLEGNEEHVVARGQQVVACMRRADGRLEPARFPDALLEALRPYEYG